MKKNASPTISRFAAVAVTAFLCSSGEAAATGASRLESKETSAIRQIERYCSKSWRTAHIPEAEWNDSTQQVLVELLQRIPREKLSQAIGTSDSQERRELNRSIWRIAKRWVRRHRHLSLEDVDVADTETHDSTIDEQMEAVFRVATRRLTEKQQEIIRHLRDGLSVAEIAASMKLPASRISNEKHRAIKQIRRYLCDAA